MKRIRHTPERDCYIVYWQGVEPVPRAWCIRCSAKDNERTIKKHLLSCVPDARFIGCIFVERKGKRK